MNDPARRTDRDLFEAASSGDSAAIAELAARHARGLYDFALRGTLDGQQAEAVLDTVFRRIRDRSIDVPAQIDFRTWLYSLGLVEVLAVSNETRTARISTDDERFYRPTTAIDVDVAHSAWQAARGLRTRDYCVLDLTLRRGLTPEEVAEAASLTRSNLYASIGRARGAFEETFAAMLLYEYGRAACRALEEIVETAPGASLRPALRHQIIEHSDSCDNCRHTLDSQPMAANVYVSLADVEMPEALGQRIAGGTAAAAPPIVEAVAPRPIVGFEAVPAGATALAAGSAVAEAATPEPSIAEDGATIEADDIEAETPEDDESDRSLLLAEDSFDEADDTDDDDDDALEDDDEDGDVVDTAPLARSVPARPVAPLLTREPVPAPVASAQAGAAAQGYEDGFGDRIAGWVDKARGQPLVWTYALLGIGAVIAIYLGVAVADSLQSGGGDSGAVPLDSPPSAAAAREIECGDTPIELNEGTENVIGFDEVALDGFSINSLAYVPVSDEASEQDLTVERASPHSIRFIAAQQDAGRAHIEEFELRIQWQREEELASSSCQLLVNVSP